MNKIKTFFIVMFLIVVSEIPVFAPPSGSWNPGDTDPTVPIHGSFFMLAGLIVLYFTRKFFNRNKRNPS